LRAIGYKNSRSQKTVPHGNLTRIRTCSPSPASLVHNSAPQRVRLCVHYKYDSKNEEKDFVFPRSPYCGACECGRFPCAVELLERRFITRHYIRARGARRYDDIRRRSRSRRGRMRRMLRRG
jgi:hypothetical protein